MGQTTAVPTADGGRVVVTAVGDGGPALLLCHGQAFSRESFLAYAQDVSSSGVTAAALDFRGYGDSQAGSDGLGARDLDVLAVLGWLAALGHAPVIALGASMGGGAVLRAALREAAVFEGGLITWSTVAIGEIRPDSAFGTGPKLFCVSADEPMHQQTIAMHAAAQSPKELVVLPGSGHAQQILSGPAAPLLKAAVSKFLARATA